MGDLQNGSIIVEGKAGIRVEVVLDSINGSGNRLTTFLVDHPRIVHAEELKHRMFSYSAASSRAIPAAKMAEQLTGMPVSFGKNQSGMQAGEDHNEPVCFDGAALTPERAWDAAKQMAVKVSQAFAEAGYHKQVYNRLTEPFQMIRVLITATETDNFFWLRNDKAADPTLAEQARCMYEAMQQSVPQVLKPGQWHLPFMDFYQEQLSVDENDVATYGTQVFYVADFEPITLENAIKVSCARCAATSFRNENYGLEKSLQVYDRLVNGEKVHAGALEHCGTPMTKRVFNMGTHMKRSDYINIPNDTSSWQPGISHADRERNLWSGNFKGFIQYRKLVPNECYKKPSNA